MIRTQDEIIHETEMKAEICRKNIAILKEKISNQEIIECLKDIENILFESIVLFYTHRKIWTQAMFWSEYACSDTPIEFATNAYNQMKKSTLVKIYSDFYFAIESALYQFFKF